MDNFDFEKEKAAAEKRAKEYCERGKKRFPEEETEEKSRSEVSLPEDKDTLLILGIVLLLLSDKGDMLTLFALLYILL